MATPQPAPSTGGIPADDGSTAESYGRARATAARRQPLLLDREV